MNTSNKPKIQKTNRIRWSHTSTIYCSSFIASQASQYCLRANNNVLVPLKGELQTLEELLFKLATTHPEHFPAPSRHILGVH